MSNDLFLKSAYMEITNQCNLFCKHCYNDSGTKKAKILDFHIIEKTIKDMSLHGVNSIAISGGEPLLHPNIHEILALSEKYKTDIQIVTNGVLLDNCIDDIKNNPFINLQVSIDGIGKSHDIFRGKSVFKSIDSNLEDLKKYNKDIAIRATVNSYNVHEYEKIIQYAIDKHARVVSFSMLCLQGRTITNSDILVSDENAKIIYTEMNNLVQKYREKIEVRPVKISNELCPFTKNEAVDISPRIDVFGNVFLCSMFTNSMFSLGNVNDEDIFDILGGEKSRTILNFLCSFQKLNKCHACYMNSICQKGCPAQYLNELPDYYDSNCSFRKKDFLDFICTQKMNIN